MKVKNIMFSGFAAAILMGTAQAATTPFEIASKAYVDSKFSTATSAASDVADAVGNMDNLNDGNDTNFGENTDTVVEALNDLDDALNTKQDKSDSTISAAQASAGNHLTEGSGVAGNLVDLDSAIGTLETKVGNDSVSDQIDDAIGDLGNDANNQPYTDVADALADKVNVSDKATSIGTTSTASNDKWATELAVATVVEGITGGAGTVDQQIASALGSDFTGDNAYADVTAALADKQDKSDSTVDANDVTAANHLTAGAGVADNLVALGNALGTVEGTVGSWDSTNQTGSGLAADVAALQNTVNDQTNGLAARMTAAEGDIDTLEATMGTGTLTGFSNGVDTVIAALNDLQSNKLNKPIPNSCSAQSQHCVLHMDNTGALSWVDITVPYMEVSGGSEEPAGSH